MARDYPPFGSTDDSVVDWVVRRWREQDAWVRPFHRQVRDNIRMVAGRHWDVWLEGRQRFVSVEHWMTSDELRWRQRPVFNWVGYWYMVTHAKLTENRPILSFLPATPDRKDLILAEVMEPIYRYQWDVIGMDEKVDQLARWVLVAGRGILKSFWDPDKGSLSQVVVPAEIPVLDEYGQPVLDEYGQPATVFVERAPAAIGPDGNPIPLIRPLPGGDYEITGDADWLPKGGINVQVLSPLEVRTSQEPVPFREKRWYMQASLVHVDEIEDRFGVRVEPDARATPDDDIASVLLGSGLFQASWHEFATESRPTEGFAFVYELWEKPHAKAPMGRHVITTAHKLLLDEENRYDPDFRPYEAADFVVIPGRPWGKSPIEDIAPVNRTYNRGWAMILEHRNLMTMPMLVVDRAAQVGEITNEPGQIITANIRAGIPPVTPLQPPQLPESVYQIQQMLRMEMQDMGSLRIGSEGRPPTRDPSGQLVRELRYNDDRYIGPAARSIVDAIAGMAENWQHLFRYGWTDEQLIRVAGESNAARFIVVRPQMFEGRVHVIGVPESMYPEGRGERQARLDFWLSAGIISPKQYFDLINHPHLSRAARPGGVHQDMAEHENAQMMRGQQVMPIEPHDDGVHLAVHQEFMASPEFVELPQEIRTIFYTHVSAHKEQIRLKATLAASDQAMMAANQVAVAAASTPQPTVPREAGPTQGA